LRSDRTTSSVIVLEGRKEGSSLSVCQIKESASFSFTFCPTMMLA
jgi:hypothetical protein